MGTSESLKRTPLYECHREAGARLVDFAGWEMPVQYQGVIEEHRAVRTAAGIFDVSHMGEVRVKGPEAEAFLQRLTPPADRLQAPPPDYHRPSSRQPSSLCHERPETSQHRHLRSHRLG